MSNASTGKKGKTQPLNYYGGDQRVATIFNWFLGLTLISLLAGVLILLSNRNFVQAAVTGAAALPVLLGIHLVARKKYEAAAALLGLIMIALITWLATLGQGVHTLSLLGIPAILITTSLVARKRIMVFLTVFSVVCVAWLVFGDIYGLYKVTPSLRSVPGDFFTVSLVLVVTAVMVRFITEALLKSNRQLQKELEERRIAEEALLFSEKRFYQAFHTSPVMMTIEDSNRQFVDVNQAFCDIMGYNRDDVLGRTAAELNLLASAEDGHKVIKTAAEQGGLNNLEVRFRRKSGEIGVALMSGDRFEVNGIPYELTSALDITERRHMQEILFEEKERAEVTLHSIGDAVISTDIQARVQYINPIAENLTGWKAPDALGQPLTNVFRVINEDTRKSVEDPVERCLREGRIVGLANHSMLVSRDGQEYSINDSAAPIRNRQGEVIGVVLVFQDVTTERRLSQQVAHDAAHDSLTGLANRREFEQRLERALVGARERGLSHILCYLDLDQFKIVNDTAGHAAGDELLKQVAGVLNGLFRQRDTLARLGGDEFGLLLENCGLEHALVICNEILSRIRGLTFIWGGNNFLVGVSIGVVPITQEKESVNQLLSQADIACYSAKDLGRDRVYVYQSEDSETIQRHSEIIQASRMRDAVANDQFLLYCQPIKLLNGQPDALQQCEVLIRMTKDDNGIIMPAAFIPSAERYGLMASIDRWVIRRTFRAMSTHDTDGMQVAINLSGNSLDDDRLLEYVLEQQREFSVPLEQICFEITETAAIRHISKAQRFIQEFREYGGRIALDDFGSGFSSFRYLKTLPVDYIKIDGVFVSDMLSNPSDQAMVEAITQIAHTLGIQVIAEHAATLETVDRLREIGVERAQGYGIGFPVPVEEAWGKK